VPAVQQIRIDADIAGVRLDNFLLRQLKGVPKSHVYRLIRDGQVRVDKKRADAAQRLTEGQIVRIPPVRVAEKSAPALPFAAAARIEIPILYEDEALLAVDKPAGLAAHGGSGVSFGLIETLRAGRPDARFLELAHRLDRETSGILLIAKKRSALKRLHELFKTRATDKRYRMLVRGHFPEPRRVVKAPLFKYLTPEGERRVRIDPENGKPSVSIFTRLEARNDISLLEAKLETGRTHQLRVHLAHLGHPILGDDKYGDFARNKALAKQPNGLKRMALHAWRLTLPHPISGEPLALEAPWPEDLARFWATMSAGDD
jgi:23S rRNA pseudouridine955/2504/2580 synthase